MGILRAFRLAQEINSERVDNVLQFPVVDGISAPWADSSHLLPALLVSDIDGLGVTDGPVSRLEALSVPAIAKARAILHAIIASRPLRQYRGAELVPPQPPWLYRSDTGISPYQRNTAILDDHIFAEASLVAVKRGSEDQILDAVHVPYDSWRVNGQRQIEIQSDGGWVVAQAKEVLWIPGPGPGLLNIASDTIRAARNLERSWAARVRNPIPLMILEEVEENGVTPKERDETLAAFRKARKDPEGAIGFLPAKFRMQVYGEKSVSLFEEGRNAVRIDIANLMNLPVSLLDGSTAEASLTYSTQEGDRNEIFDYSISYWANPLQERLSLDDVCPRGNRIRFDFTDLLTPSASPTGPITED